MKKFITLLMLMCLGLTQSVQLWAQREAKPFEWRMLNHWDNLDGTVERGYAGRSIFWPTLQRDKIEAYAQENEALGINAIVPNNVNASPRMLTREILEQTRDLADMLRPHGIRVFLAVNFASPQALGELPTADPLDKNVQKWWKNKVKEIYTLIPDFGGFLVKANSKGQPGPNDFGRTHAEGANMLARALKPYKGVVMWRAFVYSPSDPDRAKQAYLEFQPLDGQFLDNVIIQVKNGPIDFQPREAFSPLFASLRKTKVMAELQITQEYLGHSNHIAFLAPLWTEFMQQLRDYTDCQLTAVAGVANIGDGSQLGNDPTTLCGNHMAESNWYAFARLASDPTLTSEQIARDWVYRKFPALDSRLIPQARATKNIVNMMLRSHEAVVDYMMPLGLHHQFAWGHHYGPEPYCAIPGARPDWMPSYYHKADAEGLGFNRSSTGSDATGQYPEAYGQLLDNPETCPYQLLLWFHHVAWNKEIAHTYGQTTAKESLWDALCHHYQHGLDEVRQMQREWDVAEYQLGNATIFTDIQRRLRIQARDAQWWKDGCLLYFQTFSHMPFPADVEPSVHNLQELIDIKLGITNEECPTQQLLDSKR